MAQPRSGGGWPAVAYSLRKARQVGGIRNLWRAMRTRNACKTCAVGMGGQQGGMVNEAGRFPEVCKKSLQAMVADMQPAIPADFWHRYPIGRLRQLSPRELEHAGRLAHPVRYTRASGHYEAITWEEALQTIARTLGETPPDRSFWYFSGRSSNEAGFLLQLFARLYGTNNVNNCSYYCHQASGTGLTSSVGTGTATVVLEDLDQADLVILIGANPASNHPRVLESLRSVRARGGDVIVVNPMREPGLERFHVPSRPLSLLFGSEIASFFVQPHIGGDLAFLTAVAKRIVELKAHDPNFVALRCRGWNELADSLSGQSMDALCHAAGVDRAIVELVAARYASSRRTIFAWAMGITHHANGVENVQAIANLALLRGMVGKPGAGLMPIRGHSNVQGIGSVGVTPTLKKAVFEALEERLDVRLPTTAGLDTMACMEASADGRMDVGVCLGGNLFGSNPDADYAGAALRKLGLTVYLSTTLNTGHAWGAGESSIILPVLPRDEEPEPTTQESMFNFVRLSDGGPPRIEGPRSEVSVVADLAARVLGPEAPVEFGAMRSTHAIRSAIGAVIPGYEAIARIDDTKDEFQIGGRTLHEPQFATADGLARLHVHTISEPAALGPGETRLMTVRSEGQFNTVVYEEDDLYRGVVGRDVILLHPEDAKDASVAAGDRVTVHGPGGSMPGIRVELFERLRPGNSMMYFPEANRLLSRKVDPVSRTPAFKGAVVRVERLLPLMIFLVALLTGCAPAGDVVQVSASTVETPLAELQARRQALMRAHPDGLIVLPANAQEKAMEQPAWIQAASFQYFSGLSDIPGAILVLDAPAESAVVFAPPPPTSFGMPVAALGLVDHPDRAAKVGLELVLPDSLFAPWMRGRMGEVGPRVYVDGPRRPTPEGSPPGLRPVQGFHELWQLALEDALPGIQVHSAAETIRRLRWVKSPHEAQILDRNARFSARALAAGMRSVGAGKTQRQAEAAVVAACLEAGAEGPSFWPWMMSGPNGGISRLVRSFFDYQHLNRVMEPGELVRADVGCMSGGYGGDVGRTVPVSGAFSAEQARVWDLLVVGYRAGVRAMGPGVALDSVRQASRRAIWAAGLGQAELRDLAERMAAPDGVDWHIHGVGIESGETPGGDLNEGVVLAYEPMFVHGQDAFYLEDMILITADGARTLTTDLPYTAREMEAFLSGR